MIPNSFSNRIGVFICGAELARVFFLFGDVDDDDDEEQRSRQEKKP